MNKADLVNAVFKTMGDGVSRTLAERSVEAVVEAIRLELKRDQAVQFAGLGTFRVVDRKADAGVNPRIGGKVKFKASKSGEFAEGKGAPAAARRAHILSVEEAKLWTTINRTLPPAERARYRVLRGKSRKETLAVAEQEELRRLTDVVEVLHAERLKALVALAALRGETVSGLAKAAGVQVRVNA